jgi:hypothetical protein
VHRAVATLGIKWNEVATGLLCDLYSLLHKQVEYNLYRIMERNASELIERTLCDILAVHLEKLVGSYGRLMDFKTEDNSHIMSSFESQPRFCQLAY